MSEQIYIGFERTEQGHKAVGSEQTREQIDEITQYPLNVHGPDAKDGRVQWEQLYVDDLPDEPEGFPILNSIIRDREMRIDENTPMADRPPLAIVTIDDETVTRVEFYAGHDALAPKYDLKADPSADLDPSYDGN